MAQGTERKALTKRSVDAAEVPSKGERPSVTWDVDVKGFGLKVADTGTRTYIFRYRPAWKKPGRASTMQPVTYTIGRHGNLTADEARTEAKRLAGLVERKIDPREQEKAEVEARDEAERIAQEKARIEDDLAFEKVAELWLTHYETEKQRRPASVRLAKTVVNRHLVPKLKGNPMPHIGRADLQPIIDAIPAKHRGIRRAVFAYASILFGWAAKRGDIASNPLSGMVKPLAPKARDRVLSDDELAAIWKGSQKSVEPFGPFFRLLVLTGQRRNEVAEMKWPELDRASATWTIPADRAKNGVAHIVPLTALAIEEFDQLAHAAHEKEKREAKANGKNRPEDLSSDKWPKAGFVLTTTGRSAISGFSKVKGALDEEIAEARDGEPLPPWRIHDLRRTLATGLQRLGVRFEVTEAVLNHVSGAKGGIAGIYQRHDWKEEKRDALNAWAHHVAEILAPTDESNVVSLHAAKRSA